MEPTRRILVILSTAERDKAMAGLMYAKNTHDNHWFDDVRVVLFGPIERLLAEDKEMRDLGAEVFKVTAKPVACKAFADDPTVGAVMKKLGCEVEQVGGIISECIRNGYIPLVF